MCGGHTLNRMVREAKAPRNETISHMDFWGEEGSMPEEEQMQRLWLVGGGAGGTWCPSGGAKEVGGS